MTNNSTDVVVIGAGASGLTAIQKLRHAGIDAVGIEARNRIGGRVFTSYDTMSPIPIELGAEFSHGHPPEIFHTARTANLPIYNVPFHAVNIGPDGQIQADDLSGEVDQLMEDLTNLGTPENDQPFSQWVEQTSYSPEVKKRAEAFVEGFNAARKDVIGIASLALDSRASQQIGADRNYRLLSGYDTLLRCIFQATPRAESTIRLNRVAELIEWKPGAAIVHTRSMLTGDVETIHCRKVVITIPLGVLQAAPDGKGAVRFDPVPSSILNAAQALRFGQVIRVALRFREAFWENHPQFSEASFLFSQEPLFPTWWTALPVKAPLIVGWSAGPHADELLDKSEPAIIEAALASLCRITQSDRRQVGELLEAVYFHNWHQDPFARGAYSYVPAGALWARQTLAAPVENTLYFAGEATETTGHSGTVNGAIATGRRVASQILDTL